MRKQFPPEPDALHHGSINLGKALHNIDVRRLRLFVALAEELHFGRAALRMGISQPPLTKHIQALETDFAAKLFHRDRRSASLTPAGELLLSEARSLLAHADRVGEVMRGAGSLEFGSLFVGSVPFALFDVLPQVLLRFRQTFPGVRLAISEDHTGRIVDRITRGEIDFGVVWKNYGTGALGELPLITGVFHVALPLGHRLLERETVQIADLANEPIILPSRTHSPYHHDRLLAAFVAAEVTPQVDYHVPMILSQLGYVASGLGVAFVPDIAQRLPHLGIGFRPIDQTFVDYALTLIWNEDRLSEAGRQFIHVARQIRDGPAQPQSGTAPPVQGSGPQAGAPRKSGGFDQDGER